MNLVFWNLNNKIRVTEVAAIFHEYECDIAVFAEYSDDDASLLKELQGLGLYCSFLPTLGCDRIKVLVKDGAQFYSIRRESERYSFREYNAPGKIPVLLCMVHFQSKLHMTNEEQLVHAGYLKAEIEEVESELAHKNTLVFGDFNMNPFDAGMYFASAMNSVPCREVASAISRNVLGKDHSFFYNPSWNLFGDRNEAPGSYYYSGGSYGRMHWNILDQLILRPEVSGRLIKDSLRVITKAGMESLLSANKRPRLSDHLPMFFSMNFDSEVENGKSMA